MTEREQQADYLAGLFEDCASDYRSTATRLAEAFCKKVAADEAQKVADKEYQDAKIAEEAAYRLFLKERAEMVASLDAFLIQPEAKAAA